MFYCYDVNTANTIKKVYELQSIDPTHYDDIERAFCNYHYYVNPKKHSEPFEENYVRFEKYFKRELETGQLDNSSRTEVKVSIFLKVIKELFDTEYFEARLEYHKNNNDKECLFEYMTELNVEQLKQFLPTIMRSVYIFSRERNEIESVWELLNQECLKKDPVAPVTSKIYDKYGYFNENLPIYFFEFLSKETVVRLICNNICDENKYTAATLARIMYTEGIDEVEWTESAWRCDC